MNKLIVSLISMSAVFCMSGQMPNTYNQELAMTKCTKAPAAPAEPANENQNDSDENTSSRQAPAKRMSAARKVLEGLDNTSLNTERKSAAARSMEAN